MSINQIMILIVINVYTAVYAPITFEEIVMVMINGAIGFQFFFVNIGKRHEIFPDRTSSANR